MAKLSLLSMNYQLLNLRMSSQCVLRPLNGEMKLKNVFSKNEKPQRYNVPRRFQYLKAHV